jgi:hypothetical protein
MNISKLSHTGCESWMSPFKEETGETRFHDLTGSCRVTGRGRKEYEKVGLPQWLRFRRSHQR